MVPTVALWACLVLLTLWQAVLTAMVVRLREEGEAADHRVGRAAAAISEVTDHFDRIVRSRLSDLDHRGAAEPPRPARTACASCQGQGYVEAGAGAAAPATQDAEPGTPRWDEPPLRPRLSWEPPRSGGFASRPRTPGARLGAR